MTRLTTAMQHTTAHRLRRRDVLASAAATLVCAQAGSALAQASGDAARTPSAEVSAELPQAAWVGTSRMRFFGFDIYDAQLWAAPGFRASDYTSTPFALELSYLRNLDGRAIAERSLKEMRRAGTFTPDQETRWLSAMQDAFPDVRNGDRITGMHQPGRGARFWFNGKLRATIADTEFSRHFFGIWLATWTSEPRLRTALLERAAP